MDLKYINDAKNQGF